MLTEVGVVSWSREVVRGEGVRVVTGVPGVDRHLWGVQVILRSVVILGAEPHC